MNLYINVQIVKLRLRNIEIYKGNWLLETITQESTGLALCERQKSHILLILQK
jgi:hypothetical protein